MRARTGLMVAYVCALGALYVGSSWIPFDESVEIPDCASGITSSAGALCVKDPGGAVMAVVSELMNLVVTLVLLVSAGAAGLLIRGRSWSTDWNVVDVALLTAVFICSSVSLYGIYLGHVALLDAVTNGIVRPSGVRIRWALGISYYGLIIAVGLLGGVCLRLVGTRRS